MRTLLLTLFTLVSMAPLAHGQEAEPSALLMRYPDVSDTHIVFRYANNLWSVPKAGGTAMQLTSVEGPETMAKYSPDGTTLAFMGNYDGNYDLYTMAAQGGPVTRQTFHPTTENLLDWHPDGKSLLFAGSYQAWTYRYNSFYLQPLGGGMAQRLPLEYAEVGSYNADGTQLAYQYLERQGRSWKRYQGGTASDLWVYDFTTKDSEKITDYVGTDALPMWHGTKIYFLSDRDENVRLNLWSYDTDTKTFEQHTFFTDYDVKFPSQGPQEIVFENGGQLHLLNLSTNEVTPVAISVPDEAVKVRPTFKDFSDNILSYDPSPSGVRMAFSARGDIVTVPAKEGVTRNLSRTSGAAEREPVWSPDGQTLAYFSDEQGDYYLYTRPADGSGKATLINDDGPNYKSQLSWSPDGEHLAWRDNTRTLWVQKKDASKATLVFQDEYDESMQYAFSPDGRYIAYSQSVNLSNTQIRIYDIETKRDYAVTSGFYSDKYPAFTADGKHLCYVSYRHTAPLYGDLDYTFVYANSQVVMALPLQADTPSLMAPENDEEEAKKDEEEDEDKKKKRDDDAEADDTGEIDFTNMEQRAEQLKTTPGQVYQLAAADGKLLYMHRMASAQGERPKASLMLYDLEEHEEKTVTGGVTSFRLAHDGKKVAVALAQGGYSIISAAPGQNASEGQLKLNHMTYQVNPKEEWQQIFRDIWNFQRLYFYDPDMHGVDWQAEYDRYSKLIPFITTRRSLNYVVGELMGELNVGHAYIGGGETERPSTLTVGLLGIDWKKGDNGRYQVATLLRGADWEPQHRSPLLEPGLNISEGDYILAVNGIEITTDKSPHAFFQNLGGQLVELTVAPAADMKDRRPVLVKTLTSDRELRYHQWVESKRQEVYAATDGRVGYIYVPNTGIGGQNELVRQWQGQLYMEGLIIDERWNSGGQIPERFIEMLNRPLMNVWRRRDMQSFRTPYFSHIGPKVMLANEWAGSGGDAFPYYFKQAELGPVVGKRTWGGLVGINRKPGLIDGGYYSVPSFGFYSLDEEFEVEGYGVDPDYEVENPSDEMYEGKDYQLKKAIELVMEELGKPQYQAPSEETPFPVRTKRAY